MEYQAVFLKSTGEIEISQQTTPEFFLLYQQSVLLELKEQGVLDEVQYKFCLDALVNQLRNTSRREGRG